MTKSSDRQRRPGRDRPAPRPDRPDHRRTALAAEAARIIDEEGLTDFRSAKQKAVERLGLGRGSPLPNNTEIEAALAERNRIFHADTQPELLDALRLTALEAMRDLDDFHPRLVGDVLSGNTTDHSRIDLHLFSDTAEAVGAHLDGLGMSWRGTDRRYRLRRDEIGTFPVCHFALHGCEITASIFPLRLRGHPPLSPVDGRPMRRANSRELEALLDHTASSTEAINSPAGQ